MNASTGVSPVSSRMPDSATRAMVEEISFDGQREVFRNQILRLAACHFIAKRENVLITGSTGLGKSYIASAIGHQACILGYKVLYEHSNKLFARLKMAKADGSYLRGTPKDGGGKTMLIIDDFGIQPLDSQSRAILMEIIGRPPRQDIHHVHCSGTRGGMATK